MINQKKGLSKVNKLLVLVVITLLLIVVVFLVKKPVQEKQVLEKKETIKIGFIGLSDNEKTEDALAAVRIALEDINKINGKKFEILTYNINKDDGQGVKNAFKSASSDNVLAVISTVPHINQSAREEKMPTILVGGGKNESRQREEFYWSIRLVFVISDYVDETLKSIKTKYPNIKSAALVSDITELNTKKKISKLEQNEEEFLENLESLNSIKGLTYTFGDVNISSIINDIQQKNPDIIIVFANIKKSIKFLKAAKKNGLGDKLFLAFLPTAQEIIMQEESLPKRFIIAVPPTDILGSTNAAESAFEEFTNKFTLLNFTLLNGSTAGILELNSYDAVSLIAYAVSKANLTNKPESIINDREEIIKEIWAVQNFKSLVGTLAPNGKTGLIERDYIRTFYIENGRFKSARGVSI